MNKTSFSQLGEWATAGVKNVAAVAVAGKMVVESKIQELIESDEELDRGSESISRQITLPRSRSRSQTITEFQPFATVVQRAESEVGFADNEANQSIVNPTSQVSEKTLNQHTTSTTEVETLRRKIEAEQNHYRELFTVHDNFLKTLSEELEIPSGTESRELILMSIKNLGQRKLDLERIEESQVQSMEDLQKSIVMLQEELDSRSRLWKDKELTYQQRIDDLCQSKSAAESQMAQLSNARTEAARCAKTQLDSVNAETTHLRVQLQKYENEIASLRVQIDDLNHQLTHINSFTETPAEDGQVVALRLQVAAIEESNRKLYGEYNELLRKYQVAEVRCAQLESTFANSNKMLNNATEINTVADLEARLAVKSQRVDELVSQLNEIKIQQNRYKKPFDHIEDEMQKTLLFIYLLRPLIRIIAKVAGREWRVDMEDRTRRSTSLFMSNRFFLKVDNCVRTLLQFKDGSIILFGVLLSIILLF